MSLSNLSKKAGFKFCALILINAFLLMDIAFASGEKIVPSPQTTACLSPAIQIGAQDLSSGFQNYYQFKNNGKIKSSAEISRQGKTPTDYISKILSRSLINLEDIFKDVKILAAVIVFGYFTLNYFGVFIISAAYVSTAIIAALFSTGLFFKIKDSGALEKKMTKTIAFLGVLLTLNWTLQIFNIKEKINNLSAYADYINPGVITGPANFSIFYDSGKFNLNWDAVENNVIRYEIYMYNNDYRYDSVYAARYTEKTSYSWDSGHWGKGIYQFKIRAILPAQATLWSDEIRIDTRPLWVKSASLTELKEKFEIDSAYYSADTTEQLDAARELYRRWDKHPQTEDASGVKAARDILVWPRILKLRNWDPGAAHAAWYFQQLEYLGPIAIGPLKENIYSNNHIDTKKWSVHLLGHIGLLEDVMPTLIDVFENIGYVVLTEARRGFEQTLIYQQPLEKLYDLLRDDNVYVRHVAMQTRFGNLVKEGDTITATVMLDILNNDSDEWMREHAADNLLKMKDIRGAAAISNMLVAGNQSLEFNSQLAKILYELSSYIPDHDPIEFIVGDNCLRLINSTNEDVRYYAILTLGRIGDLRVGNQLVDFLLDTENEALSMRCAAATALNQLVDSLGANNTNLKNSILNAFKTVLDQADYVINDYAVEGLLKLKDLGSLESLENYKNSLPPEEASRKERVQQVMFTILDPYVINDLGLSQDSNDLEKFSFNWQDCNSAVYEIQEASGKDFNNILNSYTSLNGVLSFMDKTAGSYYYRCRTIINGVYSRWGATNVVFTQMPLAPDNFSLVQSYKNIQVYTLTWDAVAEATGYEITEADNPEFINSEVYNVDAAVTSFDFEKQQGSIYYYQIRAKVNNAVSEPTPTIPVTVVALPALENVNFKRGYSEYFCEVFWDKIPGATKYRLQFGTNENFTGYTETHTILPPETSYKYVGTFYKDQYSPTGASPVPHYYFAYFRVAGAINNIYSPWSEVMCLLPQTPENFNVQKVNEDENYFYYRLSWDPVAAVGEPIAYRIYTNAGNMYKPAETIHPNVLFGETAAEYKISKYREDNYHFNVQAVYNRKFYSEQTKTLTVSVKRPQPPVVEKEGGGNSGGCFISTVIGEKNTISDEKQRIISQTDKIEISNRENAVVKKSKVKINIKKSQIQKQNKLLFLERIIHWLFSIGFIAWIFAKNRSIQLLRRKIRLLQVYPQLRELTEDLDQAGLLKVEFIEEVLPQIAAEIEKYFHSSLRSQALKYAVEFGIDMHYSKKNKYNTLFDLLNFVPLAAKISQGDIDKFKAALINSTKLAQKNAEYPRILGIINEYKLYDLINQLVELDDLFYSAEIMLKWENKARKNNWFIDKDSISKLVEKANTEKQFLEKVKAVDKNFGKYVYYDEMKILKIQSKGTNLYPMGERPPELILASQEQLIPESVRPVETGYRDVEQGVIMMYTEYKVKSFEIKTKEKVFLTQQDNKIKSIKCQMSDQDRKKIKDLLIKINSINPEFCKKIIDKLSEVFTAYKEVSFSEIILKINEFLGADRDLGFKNRCLIKKLVEINSVFSLVRQSTLDRIFKLEFTQKIDILNYIPSNIECSI